MSPACNDGRLWVYLLYLSTILHCGGGGFPRGIVLPLPIRGVACRGLAVQEWNSGVGGGVGVALVIGQYFGLGCSGTAR